MNSAKHPLCRKEEMQADLWLSGTQPMVNANSKSAWDADFIDPQKSGRNTVLRTKNNFAYLRCFAEAPSSDLIVQMYAVKTENIYLPKENWIALYTDCAVKNQPVREKEDHTFLTNAHPFILSGLYEWTGYTLIGYYGKALQELPEEISEEFFSKDIWIRRALDDDSVNPFIINYAVPSSLLRNKRLCTSSEPVKAKDSFDIEVVPSMARDLNVDDRRESVRYNGIGGRVNEDRMVYFTLKPGRGIPASMEIITEKVEEMCKMGEKQRDLTFARSYHKSAILRDYTVSRSSRPDCGVLHTVYGSNYGGNKEWREAGARSQRMPIPDDPVSGRPSSSGGKISTSGTEIVKAEITISYPSLVAVENIPDMAEPSVENLEALAEKRNLKAGSTRFITAAIWYGTTCTESSDAFMVQLYHAYKQYLKVPNQWTSLKRTGEDVLLTYQPLQPNKRAFPSGAGSYYRWEKIPSDGWLIARVTNMNGSANPRPTEAILPDNWFDKQTQWAFIPIG